MSRLHSPRLWLALLGAAAALAVAAAVVLVGAVAGLDRGLESLLLTGLASLVGAGWFKAYQQNLRARRAERALAAARQATAAAALRDPLTGLGNRRMFDTHLQAALGRAQRYGNPFSVMLVEVNLPGGTNDGPRSAGNERIVKFVGTVLAGSLRSADILARLNEITFGVVMAETEYEGAQLAWARLRDDVLAAWPEHRAWSLSGGTAGYGVDIGSVESLLSDADRRLALEKRRLRAEPEP